MEIIQFFSSRFNLFEKMLWLWEGLGETNLVKYQGNSTYRVKQISPWALWASGQGLYSMIIE